MYSTSNNPHYTTTPGAPGQDGYECPGVCPTKCGPDDMQCYGGKDNYGCEVPDFCTPMKGGNET